MNTALAFAMGEAHRNDRLMVFDWDRAAKTIAQRNPKLAYAGLEGDFEYTGGLIWQEGKPFFKDYTYLASTWAEPVLEMDGEQIECWRYESDVPGWNAGTKWPESVLEAYGWSRWAEKQRSSDGIGKR